MLTARALVRLQDSSSSRSVLDGQRFRSGQLLAIHPAVLCCAALCMPASGIALPSYSCRAHSVRSSVCRCCDQQPISHAAFASACVALCSGSRSLRIGSLCAGWSRCPARTSGCAQGGSHRSRCGPAAAAAGNADASQSINQSINYTLF
jgi:hypothetical protein